MKDYLSALDRPIAFHRVFVEITGSVAGAVFLSQLVYWHRRAARPFYKSRNEWRDETGLSRREQESARKKLRSLKLLKEEKKGVPARIWFDLDCAALNRMVAQLVTSDQQGGRIRTNKVGGFVPTITETTAETTAVPSEPKGSSGKRTNGKSNGIDYSCLPVKDGTLIDDYIAHRKKNKLPLTQNVVNRLAKNLERCQQEGIDPDDAIGELLDAGWRTVKPNWIQRRNEQSGEPQRKRKRLA